MAPHRQQQLPRRILPDLHAQVPDPGVQQPGGGGPHADIAVIYQHRAVHSGQRRPVGVIIQGRVLDIEEQLHRVQLRRIGQQTAAPEKPALDDLTRANTALQPAEQAGVENVGNILAAVHRPGTLQAHQQVHFHPVGILHQRHRKTEQHPYRPLGGSGLHQATGEPDRLFIPVDMDGAVKILIGQGLPIHRGKIHAELAAVQDHQAAARGEGEVTAGPGYPGRAVPGLHRQLVEIPAQGPVIQGGIDIGDIQLHRGQPATGGQRADHLARRRGQRLGIAGKRRQRGQRQPGSTQSQGRTAGVQLHPGHQQLRLAPGKFQVRYRQAPALLALLCTGGEGQPIQRQRPAVIRRRQQQFVELETGLQRWLAALPGQPGLQAQCSGELQRRQVIPPQLQQGADLGGAHVQVHLARKRRRVKGIAHPLPRGLHPQAPRGDQLGLQPAATAVAQQCQVQLELALLPRGQAQRQAQLVQGHLVYRAQELLSPVRQVLVSGIEAPDTQLPLGGQLAGQAQALQLQQAGLQGSGPQAAGHIQPHPSARQFQRMVRRGGQGQAQVLQHQYRGKRVPLGADPARLHQEGKTVIEFLQDGLLVVAGERGQHPADTDVDRQQHDKADDKHPEHAAELMEK